MSLNLEMLREILVVLLDIAKRRWKVFLTPPLVAILLGSCAMRAAPTKYVASSSILLSGANRASNSSWQQPILPADQAAAVDAWLKSDQVLTSLLPALMDGEIPESLEQRDVLVKQLRARLTLEPVGGSVLEIKLTDSKAEGLGRKLELIIARLLEALIGPDQGLFNAAQFVVTTRADAFKAADDALSRAIASLPSQPPEGARTKLRQLADLRGQLRRAGNGLSGDRSALEASIAKLRDEISTDEAVIDNLDRLYTAQLAAKMALDATTSSSNTRAYVGIFSAPENLVVIGRPQDPLVGQNSALKLVAALLLLSLILGGGLVVAIEMLATRLRWRREFENLTDLPVIARMPKISGRI